MNIKILINQPKHVKSGKAQYQKYGTAVKARSFASYMLGQITEMSRIL